jgi:hypothetical protein
VSIDRSSTSRRILSGLLVTLVGALKLLALGLFGDSGLAIVGLGMVSCSSASRSSAR